MTRGTLAAVLVLTAAVGGVLGAAVVRQTDDDPRVVTVTETRVRQVAPPEPVLVEAYLYPSEGIAACFYPDTLAALLDATFTLTDANTDAVVAVGQTHSVGSETRCHVQITFETDPASVRFFDVRGAGLGAYGTGLTWGPFDLTQTHAVDLYTNEPGNLLEAVD